MANYLNKPSIFEIATAFEDGKNGEIKQKNFLFYLTTTDIME